MVQVINQDGPQPYVVTKKGDQSATAAGIYAGVFLEEATASGQVKPVDSTDGDCWGVSQEHVYDNSDTDTIEATVDRNVKVIVTTFVGFMRAAAGTYNCGALLYTDTSGRVTGTAAGPVRAMFIGNDSTVVATTNDYLGPCIVKLPNRKTSSSSVGWGNSDF